jgi:hypothetical protein
MISPDWPRIVPEEEGFCETCGWSREFCTCLDDLKYEEEPDVL